MKVTMVHLEITVLAGSLLLSLPQPLVAQGTLVVNGGFDLGTNGWTVTNMSGPGWDPNKGNPGGWVELDSLSPSLVTDPTISQMITGLIPSQSYLVSGDFSKTINRNGIPTGLSFGVALDNVHFFETADPGDFLWHSFSFAYTATASSALLSFSAQRNGTQVSYGIDNIWMGVPEPSVLVLVALGGFISAARWRGRNSRT